MICAYARVYDGFSLPAAPGFQEFHRNISLKLVYVSIKSDSLGIQEFESWNSGVEFQAKAWCEVWVFLIYIRFVQVWIRVSSESVMWSLVSSCKHSPRLSLISFKNITPCEYPIHGWIRIPQYDITKGEMNDRMNAHEKMGAHASPGSTI